MERINGMNEWVRNEWNMRAQIGRRYDWILKMQQKLCIEKNKTCEAVVCGAQVCLTKSCLICVNQV